jgi:hypothetical protein
MNTINTYLQILLDSQELTLEQENALQTHKKEVTDFLRVEFGTDPVIKYAGSHAKGTMIRDSYDLDIVCYFPFTDTRSLKEIREAVSTHLGKKYIMEDKTSAERITNLRSVSAPQDYHIDVVPGRFIEGSNDVFLHLADGEKERMQTNLKTHISHISNSGCVPVIRLVKIWAYRNNIHIKTFVLEIFVVDALTGFKNKDNLQESFIKVMEAFKDQFENIQLIDPANTNNIVSRAIGSSDKLMASDYGENVFNQINGSNNLSDWKNIFCETDTENDFIHVETNYPASSTKSFTPQAPWCDDYVDRTR